MWGVAVWQDEVLEGHRESALGSEPPVRHHLEQILGRQWLEDRNREAQGVCGLGDHLVSVDTRRYMWEQF